MRGLAAGKMSKREGSKAQLNTSHEGKTGLCDILHSGNNIQ